jgi:hypothetical protein
MAMEDNTKNDNDFQYNDSKSDRRLTGRTSDVGYVVRNTRDQKYIYIYIYIIIACESNYITTFVHNKLKR